MTPLMEQTLEQKRSRRLRLMALPYPEKVRIVERMQAAAREIRSRSGGEEGGRRRPLAKGGGGGSSSVHFARLPVEVDGDRIAGFCGSRGIRRMSLFGSVVRGDFDPVRSDVDVLVEFLPGRVPGWEFFGWAEELERILGHRVDLNSRLGRHITPHVEGELVTIYEQA